MWKGYLPEKRWKILRYCAKDGSRCEKHFAALPEARNWLADAQYEDKHNTVIVASDVTVNEWFDYWMENLICGLAPNTRRNYRERYVQNIQPVIGSMLMSDVKPMHCKVVLNCMEADYAGSTIKQTYIALEETYPDCQQNFGIHGSADR